MVPCVDVRARTAQCAHHISCLPGDRAQDMAPTRRQQPADPAPKSWFLTLVSSKRSQGSSERRLTLGWWGKPQGGPRASCKAQKYQSAKKKKRKNPQRWGYGKGTQVRQNA